MASFRVLFDRLKRLEFQQHETRRLLCEKLEAKLGDGWGVDVNPVEGVVVTCPDSINYSVGDLPDILKLPKDNAIEEIMKCCCD